MSRLFLFCVLLGFASAPWAADFARTIRVTELKAKPYSDAQTLESLAPRSRVEVLKRQSGWTQVKTAASTGWVKMLSLQLETAAQNKRGDSGLGALFNVASTGRSGSTVTTGVRGLSEEQLKNAKPDAQALQAAKRNAVSPQEARQFAAEGKLQAQSVGYLNGVQP
ncbi:MAG TPA: SH3 domain-containing protein [Sideroxyarcus sp.]|nr:SH3 domain-containing protein [Sideroxyarcus sp.]